MAKKTIDETKPEAEEARYGEELLAANWNPVVELLARSCGITREQATREARENMSDSEVDGFLNRVYTAGN